MSSTGIERLAPGVQAVPDADKNRQPESHMNCEPTQTPLEVDIAALKAKYLYERDKRLRKEGEDQYLEVEGELASYYEGDPYTPVVERPALSETLEVAVLGGGFAGLLTAARLRQLGISDVRIIDMAGDFGGTWYWNRYPGVQCDVESYCYLPLLEETGYIPKEKYARGDEIYAHCQRIGRHFDLYGKALFHTMVRSLRWDEAEKRWEIATDRGDRLLARFLVMASGPYNRPKLPGIKGISRFKGHTFHTSRWDYGYTGGSIEGGLDKLSDKRVAIIGTGATGVQVVPYLGDYCQHLYVLQRTPSSVGERLNRPTDTAWAQSLSPGWQRQRQRNLYTGTFDSFATDDVDLVCDGWTEINRNLAARLKDRPGPLSQQELDQEKDYVNFQVMERLRQRIEQTVKDKATADKLKPWYRFLCKRPTFNDQYLDAFNRSNVTLVDVSATRGVEEITEAGFIAEGREYAVDCIIFASGFEITTEYRRRVGIDCIQGRKGSSLYAHWADGFKTLHGQMTHGFPNQFFTGFIQGGVSVNVTEMYEQQAENIAYVIKETLGRGARSIEPTETAQAEWVATMRRLDRTNYEFFRECTPGYYNNEGGETFRSHLGEVYGGGFYAFDDLLRSWRAAGSLEGMQLEY